MSLFFQMVLLQERDELYAELSRFREMDHRTLVIYFLLGCCNASGVNPREWLTDILTRIPEYNSNYNLDLADLLPHNWKKLKSLQQTPDSFGVN
ncbi:MAG TPA: transposase domain-containing protein [Paludibacter sp.]|nr:transposase domain-containing protein [Prolixibacteraceae bacterium]HQB27897.1 transposase domain-containing protein [Paludibacter sp.]